MNKYLRLMRFHKPAGIALLWAPTAWALWIANQGQPSMGLVSLFLLGTILMRAAGCIINDIADRKIDKYVQRTQLRPITSGEITVQQASIACMVLLLGAAVIVLQLPTLCWYEAWGALGITLLYPFTKRFFKAPQLLLGIAFSMGIPMAYAASHTIPDGMMLGLVCLNYVWIIAYDTIYALVDREDDLKIGVRSTAILFGAKAIPIIFILLGLTHGFWVVLRWHSSLTLGFGISWMIGLGILYTQYHLLQTQTPENAMRAFLWNGIYGLVMWVGLWF
jgi:4-hydroxybenzoate polyprenyltransferase